MRMVIWVEGGIYYILQQLKYPDVIIVGLHDDEISTTSRIIFCWQMQFKQMQDGLEEKQLLSGFWNPESIFCWELMLLLQAADFAPAMAGTQVRTRLTSRVQSPKQFVS